MGVTAHTAGTEDELEKAGKLILPGVGAFDTCAGKLQEAGLQRILQKKVMEDHIPVLGICVGMQLMTEGSDEGVLPGLGWIKGKTIKFNADQLPDGCRIPHMGWTDLTLNKSSRLFTDMYPEPRFYFVHSYHVTADNGADVLASATHGQPFTAALERDNIVAVQFHPEKSHKYGLKLLENFVKYY